MEVRWKRPAVALVAIAAATTAAYLAWPAVTDYRARPDHTGVESWPATGLVKSEIEVRVVRAARNGAADLHFRWRFDASESRNSYFFVDCDSGTFSLDLAGGVVTGPCTGAPRFTYGGGHRDDVTIVARVSEPQREQWGVAYYR